jgi:hypothetical protein
MSAEIERSTAFVGSQQEIAKNGRDTSVIGRERGGRGSISDIALMRTSRY